MVAFVAAAELGATGIEFDVHQTLDGELVVLHDFALDDRFVGERIGMFSRGKEAWMSDAMFEHSAVGRGDSRPALSSTIGSLW